MPLKCETDTTEMEVEILAHADASDELSHHGMTSADFEHGQWFLTCTRCGAQWSVNDFVSIKGDEGFSFEEVSRGDGFCDEQ
jgi:non-ribosomal peptide synthetase component F